jgi:FkbM family methyltransferase
LRHFEGVFQYDATITIVAKGVGETEATQYLHVFDDEGGNNTLSQKMVDTLRSAPATSHLPCKLTKDVVQIHMTTLDHLVRECGVPFYIKVDVEGYERAVIRGLSRSVPLISIECNLPAFIDEAEDCINWLVHLNPTAKFNYAIHEPPTKFVSHEWLSATDIMRVARSGRHGYMEIFCASEL